MRFLLIRLSSLGDLILVLPAFWALRKALPHAHIAWLVRDDLKEVLEGTPGLDEIIPVRLPSFTDRYASFPKVLKGLTLWSRAIKEIGLHYFRKFDIVIDFQGLFKSALFAFFLGKERYGFRNGHEFSFLFLNKAIFLRDKTSHAVDNYLQIASHFGGTKVAEFPLFIPEGARAFCRAFLKENGIIEGDFLVFLSPTARWETKLWSVEGFAEVGDRIIEGFGAKIILSGLPKELGYLKGIKERMRNKDRVFLPPPTSIKQFFALLEASHVFLGVDSGAMHVARALGKPVVAIFGPSDPRWIGPYGQKGGVVRVNVDCSPCNKRRCEDLRCMREITPSMVYQEFERLLSEKKG
jgi:lipopolysaccharide heptosyltransferase II